MNLVAEASLASRLHRSVRRAGTKLADLLYPPRCVACGAATAEAHALCPRCWSGIAFIERPFCERLGTPFAVDIGGLLLSPAAIAEPPVFGRARAVARFDGAVREMVHRLKYGDRMDLAEAMGRMMVRAGGEILAGADVLVPVPLHRMRLFMRRFNQAAALARVISRLTGVPWEAEVLRRVRRTRPQTGLTRLQRAGNLQGAFAVPADRRAHVEGRTVVLVDDALTTGATANAASRALLRAGAQQVDVLAFARVVVGGD